MKSWNLYLDGNDTKPVVVETLEGPAYLILAQKLWGLSEEKIYPIFEKKELPDFIKNWKRAWGKSQKDFDLYTFDEYYGNGFAHFYYMYVCNPLLRLQAWAEKQTELKSHKINLSFEEYEKIYSTNHKDHDWLYNTLQQRNMCPVCDYNMGNAHDTGFAPLSYDICPQCGTEFGNDDEIKTWKELREEWEAAGKPFKMPQFKN